MRSITSLGENISAQIGSGVNKNALNDLVFSLGREGAEALRKGDYETALDRFTACTKINEKICKKDDVNYGASLHNMATALHYLGEINQAEQIYEKAKAVFEAQSNGPFKPSQKHRIKFIEERLTLLRFGAKPSSETYIDEFGVERPTVFRHDPFEDDVTVAERCEKAYWKGVGFAKSRIWSLAQESFEDAIALAERSGRRVTVERLMLCHNNLGVVLEEQGMLEAAIDELRTAETMMLDLPGGLAADPDRMEKLRRIELRISACEEQLANPRPPPASARYPPDARSDSYGQSDYPPPRSEYPPSRPPARERSARPDAGPGYTRGSGGGEGREGYARGGEADAYAGRAASRYSADADQGYADERGAYRAGSAPSRRYEEDLLAATGRAADEAGGEMTGGRPLPHAARVDPYAHRYEQRERAPPERADGPYADGRGAGAKPRGRSTPVDPASHYYYAKPAPPKPEPPDELEEQEPGRGRYAGREEDDGRADYAPRVRGGGGGYGRGDASGGNGRGAYGEREGGAAYERGGYGRNSHVRVGYARGGGGGYERDNGGGGYGRRGGERAGGYDREEGGRRHEGRPANGGGGYDHGGYEREPPAQVDLLGLNEPEPDPLAGVSDVELLGSVLGAATLSGSNGAGAGGRAAPHFAQGGAAPSRAAAAPGGFGDAGAGFGGGVGFGGDGFGSGSFGGGGGGFGGAAGSGFDAAARGCDQFGQRPFGGGAAHAGGGSYGGQRAAQDDDDELL